jgi:hypothetical protein
VRMGPPYWAKLSAQLWIGVVDAICRDRRVPAGPATGRRMIWTQLRA